MFQSSNLKEKFYCFRCTPYVMEERKKKKKNFFLILISSRCLISYSLNNLKVNEKNTKKLCYWFRLWIINRRINPYSKSLGISIFSLVFHSVEVDHINVTGSQGLNCLQKMSVFFRQLENLYDLQDFNHWGNRISCN